VPSGPAGLFMRPRRTKRHHLVGVRLAFAFGPLWSLIGVVGLSCGGQLTLRTTMTATHRSYATPGDAIQPTG
ncbi:hypothetical protein JZU48_01370, partial [bacterium]|nr:hypothetical protein [bacterium]